MDGWHRVASQSFCQVEYALDEPPTGALATFLSVAQWISLPAFTLEVAVKLIAFGEHPAGFFTDAPDGFFNSFDLLVVVMSYAFLSSESGSLVTVCRLLRCIKIMSHVPQLRVILTGLCAGMVRARGCCPTRLSLPRPCPSCSPRRASAPSPPAFGCASTSPIPSPFQIRRSSFFASPMAL